MTAATTSLVPSVWIGVQLYTHQTLRITVSVLGIIKVYIEGVTLKES